MNKELPESLRDPNAVRERGQYLLRLQAAGCHRLGENTGCWRIRCNLGGRCVFADKASSASKSIHEQEVECTENACDWYGIVDDCLPDVDGDGTLGCPLCQAAVREVTAPKASEGRSDD